MIAPDEVGDLLAVIAGIDARTVAKDDIALWLAALQRERVTLAEARWAVMEQVAKEPGNRMNVGHVIARVKDRRRLMRERPGAGAALQAALRAVPADAPDYGERVRALLRGPVTTASVPRPELGAATAVDRIRRGRALIDAALAERRKAAAAPAAVEPDRERDHRAAAAAAAHRATRKRSSDPAPLGQAVIDTARLLQTRRHTQPAE
ncbi:hypothetical protein [Glycomyces sp. YM15]|uniref:hypothetical protein n=1 Tax=Glycomyces sp. YM15 TaxID=2800446 RepID=UPI001965BCD7|nr:hypothetical protein [Glycomyces sp. YM15]